MTTVLAVGCAAGAFRTAVPSTEVSPGTSDGRSLSTPPPSDLASTCVVAYEFDDAGPGMSITGHGFAPDTPLSLTFGDAKGSITFTESDFAELRSDSRGAFEIHLFAERENVGEANLELAGAGCTARTLLVTPADLFPVPCEPTDGRAATGGKATESYASMILGDEPASYWRFEESSGPDVRNERGQDGTLTRGIAMAQPGFMEGSRSILLDGDDWVDVPDMDLGGDFTIEAWLRFCGETIDENDGLAGRRAVGHADINFFEARMRLYSGIDDRAIAEEPVSTRGWQHVAVTRASDALGLYLNGEKVGSGDWTGVFPAHYLGLAGGGTLEAWLDDLAIYEHALSGDNIALRAATAGV